MTEKTGYTTDSLRGLGIVHFRPETFDTNENRVSIFQNGKPMKINGIIYTYNYELAEQIVKYLRQVSDDEYAIKNPYHNE